MAEIKLSNGMTALVDDDDFGRVSQFKWHCLRQDQLYAIRHFPRVGKVYRSERLHRFILQVPKGMDIDHINGNGLDCRKSNLRIATKSQNQANRKKYSKYPYKGIKSMRKRWQARITKDRVQHFLGTFDTPEQAANAYDVAARKFHGEFACVNFPNEGERSA